MSIWLVDPTTRFPLPAKPSKERELAYAAAHWRPGWRSGFNRDENGVVTSMWFGLCRDACCALLNARFSEDDGSTQPVETVP